MRNLKEYTVLLVEDDAKEAYYFSRVLEMVFGKVLYAKNGLLALDYLDVNDLDLIITDISMPQMDGIKLIEKIKNKNLTTPIIIVTAFLKNKQRKLEKLNINAIIEKPINVNQFIVTCEEAIKNLDINKESFC